MISRWFYANEDVIERAYLFRCYGHVCVLQLPCWSVIIEYLVNISKRRAFWSLNKDILKITILKTNTPYPSRKIRHIRACTHQRPRRKRVQYVVSSEDQYAVLEIYVLIQLINTTYPLPLDMAYRSSGTVLGSWITSITVNCKNAYELKGKFLDDLHNNAFSRTNGKDAVEHIEYYLRIIDPIKLPNVDHDKLRIVVFLISLAGGARRWLPKNQSLAGST
ncbi:hypothetical protein Tco_0784527 [Tanacetum coccineum]